MVDTAGWLRQKRSANSGRLFASPLSSFWSRCTLSQTCLFLSPRKYLFRQSRSGKAVSGVTFPVRPPSSNGTRTMTPMFFSRQQRKQFLFRRLVEDIVDHLECVGEFASSKFESRLRRVVVDRDSESPDLSLFLQASNGIPPIAFVAAIHPTRHGTVAHQGSRHRDSSDSSQCTQ